MDTEMTDSVLSSQNVISDEPAETQILDILKTILRTNLSEDSKDLFPESCRVLKVILLNISENPLDQKYRMVKLTNPKFSKFIGKFKSGLMLLELLGFQEVQDELNPVFICTNDNVDVFKPFAKIIDKTLEKQQDKQNSQKYEFIEPETVAPKVINKKTGHIKASSTKDLQNQLKEYRNKHKTNKIKNQKIWTLNDLKKFDESQADEIHSKKQNKNYSIVQNSGPRMNQVYDSIASFTDPRNLMLRAFELSNEFRVSQKRKPLVWDEGLSRIAFGHSKDMGDGIVPFGHHGFNQRFKRFPFAIVRGGGENVAYNYGHGDPSKVCVDGWIDSPGHRKNLLGHFDCMGIGLYINQSGYYYYTQLFALL